MSAVAKRNMTLLFFFGSLHHCFDHSEILRLLVKNNLNYNGKILIANDTVSPRYNKVLPYPWGIRLDGESFRAICKWGWVELGFTFEYLQTIFSQLDYELITHPVLPNVPMSEMYTAVPKYLAEENTQFDSNKELDASIVISEYYFFESTLILKNIKLTNTGYACWNFKNNSIRIGWRVSNSNNQNIHEGRYLLELDEICPTQSFEIEEITIPCSANSTISLQMVWEDWQWFGQQLEFNN